MNSSQKSINSAIGEFLHKYGNFGQRINSEAQIHANLPSVILKLQGEGTLDHLIKEMKRIFDNEVNYTLQMLEIMKTENEIEAPFSKHSNSFDLKEQLLNNIYIFKENFKSTLRMLDDLWSNYISIESTLDGFVHRFELSRQLKNLNSQCFEIQEEVDEEEIDSIKAPECKLEVLQCQEPSPSIMHIAGGSTSSISRSQELKEFTPVLKQKLEIFRGKYEKKGRVRDENNEIRLSNGKGVSNSARRRVNDRIPFDSQISYISKYAKDRIGWNGSAKNHKRSRSKGKKLGKAKSINKGPQRFANKDEIDDLQRHLPRTSSETLINKQNIEIN